MFEICYCETKQIHSYLENNDCLFDKWNFRQKAYSEQSNTKTIPIAWLDEPIHPIKKDSIQFFNIDEHLNVLANDCLQNLLIVTHGYFVRAMIVKLLPNSEVSPHVDSGIVLEKTRRFHLPIKTNSNVKFYSEENEFYLKQNFWYELQNKKQHSVKNNSDEDRIHLICDIYNTKI
jgi:hypothetical protein